PVHGRSYRREPLGPEWAHRVVREDDADLR
ncbi:MAG: hypothetical protein JWM31_1916, partial [Solirubrobacterales bacterium]|nr:hypothetical protein [Solirubrobacterales bacterium]